MGTIFEMVGLNNGKYRKGMIDGLEKVFHATGQIGLGLGSIMRRCTRIVSINLRWAPCEHMNKTHYQNNKQTQKQNTLAKHTSKTHKQTHTSKHTQAKHMSKTNEQNTRAKHTSKHTQSKHTSKTNEENTRTKQMNKTHKQNTQAKHTSKTHEQNTEAKHTNKTNWIGFNYALGLFQSISDGLHVNT